MPVDDVRDLYQAANRANVAFYPLDPRGLTMSTRRSRADRGEIMAMVMPPREFMETLAAETGGRAIVQKNDITAALGQVIRDSRAYYLIAYESPHPDDGKFHKVTVRVKRPRATVFARTGYWAFKRGENTITASPSLTAVSAGGAGRRRPAGRLAAAGRGRARRRAAARHHAAADAAPRRRRCWPRRRSAWPVDEWWASRSTRREFRRTDTLVVRAAFAPPQLRRGRQRTRRRSFPDACSIAAVSR